MTDPTDRTITLKVRTNAYDARVLFGLLATWLDVHSYHRRIDLFEQRVDGVDMETDDDHTKELSTEESLSYGGSD